MTGPIFIDAIVGPRVVEPKVADDAAGRPVFLEDFVERVLNKARAFQLENPEVVEPMVTVIDPRDPIGQAVLERLEVNHEYIDLGTSVALYYVVCCSRAGASEMFGTLPAENGIMSAERDGAALAVVALGGVWAPGSWRSRVPV